MNLFGNYFKKTPVVQVDDPAFGRLTYEQGIWSFIPKHPEDGFMVTVDAPESGPTQLQRDFCEKIRSSLAEFERRARDFMRPSVDQGGDVARLSVYSIEIGSDAECEHERFVLEMCDKEATIIHRVSFRGGDPVDYEFDG